MLLSANDGFTSSNNVQDKRQLDTSIPRDYKRKPKPSACGSIIHHDQMGFITAMQGGGSTHTQKSTHVHHGSRMKKKNMILSVGAGKASDEIQHHFMINTPNYS